MVTRFAETADGGTAAALQGKLAEAAERFGKLCQQQQEKEEVLKGLLPKVEQYEQLSEKLQQFMESRARMLASGNQPERDIARFSQHLQVSCASPCQRGVGSACAGLLGAAILWGLHPAHAAPAAPGPQEPAACSRKGARLEQLRLFAAVRDGNGISLEPAQSSDGISLLGADPNIVRLYQLKPP